MRKVTARHWSVAGLMLFEADIKYYIGLLLMSSFTNPKSDALIIKQIDFTSPKDYKLSIYLFTSNSENTQI